MAVDVLKYMSKSDIERMWYEDEILAEIDQEAEIDYARKEERIKMAENLIRMGLSNSQISEAADFTLSEKDIEVLRGNG